MHRNGLTPTLTCLFFALFITACSSDDSNDNNPDTGSQPDTSVPDPPADELSTDEIKRGASASIGSAIDVPVQGASQSIGGLSDNGAQPVDDLLWDDDSQSLIDQTLQLGNENNTTRTGTTITIDPDESALCMETADDQQERERCETLLRDLLVQLNATSETSGTLTYLYQSEPLMAIGYSPVSESFEVNLGNMQRLINDSEELDSSVSFTPESNAVTSLQGAVKISATVSNQTVGAEASNASIEVSQPISYSLSDGSSSFSMATGKLIEFATDEAAGTARIELDIGEISTSGTDGNRTQTRNLKGLTAILNANENDNQLVVSNLGIGNGPLIVAVDEEEATNLNLDTFGFTIAEGPDGESITLTGALDIRVAINEILDDGSVSSTINNIFELTAPAGTSFLGKENGSRQVSSGGPLISTISGTSADGSPVSDMVEVTAGQCFIDPATDDSAGQIVDCDQVIDPPFFTD